MDTVHPSQNQLNARSRRHFEIVDNRDEILYHSPGDATRYLLPLESVHPGNRVVLCCRVSNRSQCDGEGNNHLLGMAADMWDHVASREAVLVGLDAVVASGYDPIWLGEGVRKANERGARFVVVESPNRAVRHPHYGERQWLQPREMEWEEQRRMTGSFPVVSVVRPGADPCEERAHETCRPTRRRNHPRELKDIVLALHRAGFSVREIERELNVLTAPFRWPGPHRPAPPPRDYTTISRWVKKASSVQQLSAVGSDAVSCPVVRPIMAGRML